MKKLMSFALLIALSIVFVSCASSEVDVTASEDTEPAVTETTYVSGPFSEADLIFSHEGHSFPLRSDVKDLLAYFGEDYEEITAPSCAFEGEDKEYHYEHIMILTNPVQDIDMVDEIMITGGPYMTPRGIKVGDSYDSVIEAYGEGQDAQGQLIYTESGDPEDYTSPRLFINIVDGQVDSFSFYAVLHSNF